MTLVRNAQVFLIATNIQTLHALFWYNSAKLYAAIYSLLHNFYDVTVLADQLTSLSCFGTL